MHCSSELLPSHHYDQDQDLASRFCNAKTADTSRFSDRIFHTWKAFAFFFQEWNYRQSLRCCKIIKYVHWQIILVMWIQYFLLHNKKKLQCCLFSVEYNQVIQLEIQWPLAIILRLWLNLNEATVEEFTRPISLDSFFTWTRSRREDNVLMFELLLTILLTLKWKHKTQYYMRTRQAQ